MLKFINIFCPCTIMHNYVCLIIYPHWYSTKMVLLFVLSQIQNSLKKFTSRTRNKLENIRLHHGTILIQSPLVSYLSNAGIIFDKNNEIRIMKTSITCLLKSSSIF